MKFKGFMRYLIFFQFFAFLLWSCTSIPISQPATTTIPETTTQSMIPTKASIESSIEETATPLLKEQDYEIARAQMVQEGIVGWGIEDEEVIEVMGTVPRHMFVPDEYLSQAYKNYPLPIGYGQTISQPFIVALMTQELGVTEGDRVLEIGTGSGYQAAVLANLGVEVYTIEIIGPLAEQAAIKFQELGYSNIISKHADGYYGWEEVAPFDAIIVTAAPDHVPLPLLGQLREGGIMVIPVGPVGGFQELWQITRTSEDSYQSKSLGGVTFVPLTRIE
jgi:protein-L-isoaspartate(D-aspartate) O-methyltransferase